MRERVRVRGMDELVKSYRMYLQGLFEAWRIEDVGGLEDRHVDEVEGALWGLLRDASVKQLELDA